MEIKSGISTKSKSLHIYYDNYRPKTCIRTSLMHHKDQEWLLNIPLYGFLAWLEKKEK